MIKRNFSELDEVESELDEVEKQYPIWYFCLSQPDFLHSGLLKLWQEDWRTQRKMLIARSLFLIFWSLIAIWQIYSLFFQQESYLRIFLRVLSFFSTLGMMIYLIHVDVQIVYLNFILKQVTSEIEKQ